jgi:hypothetical protein
MDRPQHFETTAARRKRLGCRSGHGKVKRKKAFTSNRSASMTNSPATLHSPLIQIFWLVRWSLSDTIYINTHVCVLELPLAIRGRRHPCHRTTYFFTLSICAPQD